MLIQLPGDANPAFALGPFADHDQGGRNVNDRNGRSPDRRFDVVGIRLAGVPLPINLGDDQRLISAFATALLTLLGAVGERLGMDRLLKSNTSKTRTHSLFRQGCMLYELIPNMPEHRLLPLIEQFAQAVSNAGWCIPPAADEKIRG